MARRTRFRQLVPFVLTTLLLAGCVTTKADVKPTEGSSPPMHRPSVIAIIDSGINPYHVAFAATSSSDVSTYEPLIPDAKPFKVSATGDYSARLNHDSGMWSHIERGQLYALEGTRLLAISFLPPEQKPFILDEVGHGTQVASLAAREDPHALIVMIQVDGSLCTNAACLSNPSFAEALSWVASQPWIDIISISAGNPGNPPDSPALDPGMKPHLDASHEAARSGKILVNAGGNTVIPPLADYFCGPPWIIAVGGAEAKTRGESLIAAKGIDVVANFTDWTAQKKSVDGMGWAQGVSMGTPIVAATLSRSLDMIRQEIGDTAWTHERGILADGALKDGTRFSLTPSALRGALNESAVSFSATEWNPMNGPANETNVNLAGPNVPVIVPFEQLGWGYVNSSLAPIIARHVLDKAPMPADKLATATYQAQWQALREQYWSTTT